MNKKIFSLIAIPAVLVSLGSCGRTPTIDNVEDEKDITIDYQAAIKTLRTGFKATGNLNVSTKYFDDEDHYVPSETVAAKSKTIESLLTYTNSDTYTGMDYKYNELLEDKTKKYIAADNMYESEEHLAFNQVDYDNVLRDGFFAIDEFNNYVPYASNAAVNPFTLIDAKDFTTSGKSSILNRLKSSLAFGSLFQMLDFVPVNLNVKPATFTFVDGVLKTAKFETYPYNSVETVDYKNYYSETIYSVEFAISEVGTANAKLEIQPEPEKPENDVIKDALFKLANTRNYRVNRHYRAISNGEPIQQEETIDVYFVGNKNAVYQAVYDGGPTNRPKEPTLADALYIDSPKDEDTKLNAYMYGETGVEGEYKFRKTPELSSIDNVGEYKDFALQNLSLVSEDIFNVNDDGSYTPIPATLKYIASDIFVPFLCTTNEIVGGYVTDFKLYLTDNYQDLDRIEIKTFMGGIEGTITFRYDQIGTAQIPFDALNNIAE